jgi:branched-chain amino acid transport system substrate-binding protein
VKRFAALLALLASFSAHAFVVPMPVITGAAATSAITASIASRNNQSNEPSPLIVKIGHVAPLTGESANMGKDDQNGAVLAIEELNQKGLSLKGQPLQFVLKSEDNAADPRTATNVAQKLVDSGVVAVIDGQLSSTAIPDARIYAQAWIPQIANAASDPTLTKLGYPSVFRLTGTDSQQGPALADYAIEKLHYKTFAVQDDQTAYGHGLAEAFAAQVKAKGGKVVYRGGNSNKQVDFKAVLTTIKGKHPDALFYAGEEATTAPIFKQAIELGLKTQFLTGDSGCVDELARLTGTAATDRLTCSEPDTAFSLIPNGQAFAAKYKARFHQDIVDYAPYSYDAVNLIADAILRAKSTQPLDIMKALKTSKYQGITTFVSFDKFGDLQHPVVSISKYVKGVKTPFIIVKP